MYERFERFLEVVLGRAVRLHRALAQFVAAPPPGVETYLIGSDSRSTPAAVELFPSGSTWRAHFGSGLALAPGDGTVTVRSLTWARWSESPNGQGSLGEPFPTALFADDHVGLVTNRAVLEHLTEVLAR